jgi:putative DNA primase/helicase
MAIKKIDRMYQLYQENVSQGMAEDLAARLGVTYDSIVELGTGYAPVVQFKNGPSAIGWWAFPERDSKGTVVGLGLRHCKPEGQPDLKAMFLPSNRGLIYAVNPSHQLGQPAYKAGKQNWVRTMDAKLECPVCGKPDGCLISSDDPDNPSAVICIRVEHGSTKEVGSGGGWLHNLTSTGFDKFAQVLPTSDHPVLVVEGATDTLAGMDIGLVTVGKPNAKGGLQELATLLRGRRVIIMGENDKKDDGSHPGRDGMMLTAQVLQRVCKDVLKVMPPPEYKDLRTWRAGAGITLEPFLAYCEQRGDRTASVKLLSDDRAKTAGLAFLNDEYRLGDRYLIRQQVNTLYQYDGSKYREVTAKEITGEMYGWAHDRLHTVETNKGPTPKPIKADRAWVASVMDSIIHDIRIHRDVKTPSWINGVEGPPSHELIPFQNGLLHLPSFMAGKDVSEYLLPCTPDYFNMVCLPYDFDETATANDFLKFVTFALPPEEIKLLRQWMGYCLVWDNQFQKFMLLRGVKLSGKSTILNLIADLVGLSQYSGPSFAQITGKYSMGDLVGKLVLGIDEADITKSSDVDAISAIIKTLSGDSPQKAEEKYKKAEDKDLCARITMTANETPYLPDNADAVARRMMIIEFNNPAPKEDTKLRQKFRNELSGIALWALQGLCEIYETDENGNFVGFSEPESMLAAKAAWREHANPMGTFYSQCCEHTPGVYTPMSEIRDAFNGFQTERGSGVWGLARIQERLRLSAPPGVVSRKIRLENKRVITVMDNISLHDWAAEVYLQGDA